MCLNMLHTNQVQFWPGRLADPPGLGVLWTCQDWCLTDKQVNATLLSRSGPVKAAMNSLDRVMEPT